MSFLPPSGGKRTFSGQEMKKKQENKTMVTRFQTLESLHFHFDQFSLLMSDV